MIDAFIARHKLPPEFAALAESFYQPLCDWLLPQFGAKPAVLGINGAQGTGKSTLADFVVEFFGAKKLNVVCISIDDLYLTRADRLALADSVHPLLVTRGIPGTHDIQAGLTYLQALKKGNTCQLMRFDKSIDDRAPESQWLSCNTAPDLIILEGWCVGSTPQQPADLLAPMNALEEKEDAEGIWRRYGNDALHSYQDLFAQLDYLIMLKAPDFDCVYNWRLEQEQKLAAKIGEAAGIMSAQQIARFIQHYERLTKHNLATMPERADVVFNLRADHQIASAIYAEKGSKQLAQRENFLAEQGGNNDV